MSPKISIFLMKELFEVLIHSSWYHCSEVWIGKKIDYFQIDYKISESVLFSLSTP